MNPHRHGPSRGGRGRHRGGRAHHPQADDQVADHWPGYLEGGYFDDHGNLRIEYVSREKVEPLVEIMCRRRPLLTAHQIRRYFGHCRAIETRLRANAKAWEDVWPDVKKLDVAAADGAAKQPAKIPALFHDFIRRNVAAIRCEKDFVDGFLPHFEALVGFGQAHFKRERN